MPKRKYTDEIEEYIKRQYCRDRRSSQYLARKYGCEHHYIVAIVRRRGGRVRTRHESRRAFSDCDRSRVKQMYEQEGLSLRQIAEQFRCDSHTVINAMNRWGIPRRPGGIPLRKVLRNTHGYVLVHTPLHPLANKVGRVMLQRLIMEKKTGRPLTKKERVHHINLDKDDNHVDNLWLCRNSSEHGKLHGQLGKVVSESIKLGFIRFKAGRYSLSHNEIEKAIGVGMMLGEALVDAKARNA